MIDRIEAEIALLRKHYQVVDFVSEGRWARLQPYRTGAGWSIDPIAVAFQVPIGFPGAPPYGFYVPADLRHGGAVPGNYQPNPKQPPFDGRWAMLSWATDGSWFPTADLMTGSNLLNWVLSFADRFAQGA